MTSQTRTRILCAPDTLSQAAGPQAASPVQAASPLHAPGSAPEDGAAEPSLTPAQQLAATERASQQASVELELAYGCVDWYLYPETRKDA